MDRRGIRALRCRYCDVEKPVEEFYLIGKGASKRRDRRCRDCMEAIPLDEVYRRFNAKCALCHRHVPRAHASIDHIIPVSRGGRHSWENVQLAHRRCNHLKGDTPPWEATGFAAA